MKLRVLIILLLALALLCSCSVRLAESEPESSSGRSEFSWPELDFRGSKSSDPEPAPPEPVDDEWFSGCCLLGDSLTDGMRLFSGLDTPDYLCSGGADTSNILERTSEGKSGTVASYLASEQYRAVFIMIGVNEIGALPSGYSERYEQLLDFVIARQPEADIYVQSLLPVTAAKNAEGQFTNERISEFNEVLKDICEKRNLVYADLHSEFTNEHGCLPDNYSWDGLHLTVEAYEHWADCLRLFAAEW